MDHDQSPQLTLDGMAAQQPNDRLFLAVFPDAETAARIAALAQSLRSELGLQGKPLRADRLHVTLHHLGDHAGLRQDIVANATNAAARMASSAFEVVFDRAGSFAGRQRNQPCVLRGDQGLVSLAAMQRELGERMNLAGLSRWVGKTFTPHVTLLYDDRSVAVQPIEPIDWKVREFVLVHSLVGRTEHRILGRWPLHT